MRTEFVAGVAVCMVIAILAVVRVEAAEGRTSALRRIDAMHLPNVVQVHPKVMSGGTPDGDEGFRELVALGVKTVLSVDGACPDVEAATRHGLKYIHLPHGYDGIPERRAWELAKAVRDLDGRIYIHCHHGKHRSPAAAVVACVAANMLGPGDDSLAVLTLAGTNPHYRGLYATAREARPLSGAALNALEVEFRSSVDPPPMAQAMVAIEHTYDRLQTIAAAGWKPPIDHPDLDPALQALLLREHFTELLRSEEKRTPFTQRKGFAAQQNQQDSSTEDSTTEDSTTQGRFLTQLREAEQLARALEESLRTKRSGAQSGQLNPAEWPTQLASTQIWERVTANCTACHAEFRDVPLSEKR